MLDHVSTRRSNCRCSVLTQYSSFDLLNDRISFFGVGSFGEDGDEESCKQVPLNDAKDKPIEEPDSSSEFLVICVPFLGTNETHKAHCKHIWLSNRVTFSRQLYNRNRSLILTFSQHMELIALTIMRSTSVWV
jgi:hypothetical protein